MITPSRNHRHAFTLIELLVSMTLFAVVVSVAVGGFIRALRTQRQLTSFAATNSNISLVVEQMAREIRTGRDFVASRDDELQFTNGRGEPVTYQLDATAHTLTRGSGSSPVPLTSPSIEVRSFRVTLRHEDPTDGYPARVTISLTIAPKELGVDTTDVHVQTTVSARSLGT